SISPHSGNGQRKSAAFAALFCSVREEPASRVRTYFTSKSDVLTTLPSSEISTLYLPVGQPSGLLIWKLVVPGPANEMSLLSSCTTWLLSTWVHFAPSVPVTLDAASLVCVSTAAWIVSVGANVVDAAVTFWSGPTALPRLTATTDAVGVTAGNAGAGSGAVVTGGVTTASSFFLQPIRAALPITATSRAWDMRVVFIWRSFLDCGMGRARSGGGGIVGRAVTIGVDGRQPDRLPREHAVRVVDGVAVGLVDLPPVLCLAVEALRDR